MRLSYSFEKATPLPIERLRAVYSESLSFFKALEPSQLKIAVGSAHAALFKSGEYQDENPDEQNERIKNYIATAALLEVGFGQTESPKPALRGPIQDAGWMEAELRELGQKLGLHPVLRTVVEGGERKQAYELSLSPETDGCLSDLKPYEGQSWNYVHQSFDEFRAVSTGKSLEESRAKLAALKAR